MPKLPKRRAIRAGGGGGRRMKMKSQGIKDFPGRPDRPAQQMTSRILSALSLTIWLFAFLELRLFQVQIVQAGKFRKIAHLEHFEKIAIPALRGNIFDRNGALLGISTTGWSLAAFPQNVRNKKEEAEKLSSILRIPASQIFRWINTSSLFVWIARKISEQKVAELRLLSLPGIELIKEPTGKRIYPKGALACHVLGYTGVDDQGLDGVELFYDKQLRGVPGYFLAETDGLGRILPGGAMKRNPAVTGSHLTLTIDETIQYVTERELRSVVKSTKALHGTILVMDPKNGEILALANYPSFNGNFYNRYPPPVLRDSAISDRYEPGSTLKAILAAAALASRKALPEEKFLAGPEITVDGWPIRNADDGLLIGSPYQTLETILINSLNVGAASIALKIGESDFSGMMRKLGCYNQTGIDLPGEAGSEIPDLPWKKVQLSTIAFGQGLAMTPIQLLTAYAAFANGGYLVQPHLMKRITSSEGVSTEFPENRVHVLAPAVVEEMKYLLQQVVKKGTGVQAAISRYTVAGKTGTAQIAQGGSYLPGKYVASFVGLAPLENPAFVILVKVDQPKPPYWGGTVAAPVFRKVAQEALWHLAIPPSTGMVQVGSWKLFPVVSPKPH